MLGEHTQKTCMDIYFSPSNLHQAPTNIQLEQTQAFPDVIFDSVNLPWIVVLSLDKAWE